MNEEAYKTGDQIAKEDLQWKYLFSGGTKTGKSRTFLDAVVYLIKKLNYSPDEIAFRIIDCDDRLKPLLKQPIIPNEYKKCIKIRTCHNFKEVKEATEDFLAELEELVENGLPRKGTLIGLDNLGSAWLWAREYYCENIYGMKLEEKMTKTKKKAHMKGKAMLPVFDPVRDYGFINEIHNDWIDSIKFSGFNYIWTSLLKTITVESTANTGKIEKQKEEGQKGNVARVDFIIWKYKQQGKFYADLIGSGSTSECFSGLENPTFERIIEAIEKIEKKEYKTAEAELKAMMAKVKKKPKKSPPKEKPKKEELAKEEPEDEAEPEEKEEKSKKESKPKKSASKSQSKKDEEKKGEKPDKEKDQKDEPEEKKKKKDGKEEDWEDFW